MTLLRRIFMTDGLIILVLLVIVGLAASYVIRAKKNGQKCIGCPYSKTCSGGCACRKDC